MAGIVVEHILVFHVRSSSCKIAFTLLIAWHYYFLFFRLSFLLALSVLDLINFFNSRPLLVLLLMAIASASEFACGIVLVEHAAVRHRVYHYVHLSTPENVTACSFKINGLLLCTLLYPLKGFG